MPRRSVLSISEREILLALSDTEDELIRYYTLSESDLAVIRQHRGGANRLGFAVQLCYMRYPGIALATGEAPFPPLMRLVAAQVKASMESWDEYGRRAETRRKHPLELQSLFGFQTFTTQHYRASLNELDGLAAQTCPAPKDEDVLIRDCLSS